MSFIIFVHSLFFYWFHLCSVSNLGCRYKIFCTCLYTNAHAERDIDSTEYCMCITRSSWTVCHLILHDREQIRKWTFWGSVILFAKHLFCSTSIDNVSYMIRGYGRKNLMSESFNPLISLKLSAKPQEQLSQNVGAAPTERPNQKRSKNFSEQEDTILVSAWFNVSTDPIKLGAPIGIEFMITSTLTRISFP